jgi:hypothetical protein
MIRSYDHLQVAIYLLGFTRLTTDPLSAYFYLKMVQLDINHHSTRQIGDIKVNLIRITEKRIKISWLRLV